MIVPLTIIWCLVGLVIDVVVFSVLISVLRHLVFTILAELGNSDIEMILGFSWDF